jgi:hypothetical protein
MRKPDFAKRLCGIGPAVVAALALGVLALGDDSRSPERGERGVVRCANLIYGAGKTSVCFADHFLEEIEEKTYVVAAETFTPVSLESPELYLHPFAVMTGEGNFELSGTQRDNLRDYLEHGGFLVASAGCSSREWGQSFRSEVAKIFPEVELEPLEPDHPIFSTVYEIGELTTKKNRQARLEGLEIEGRIVVVFSADGLNDTASAGGSCCCCGGDEVKNARRINVNLLAYALTH